MRVTVKLTAAERRRGVDLRDVLKGRARKAAQPKAFKKSTEPPAEFRAIAFVGTTLHDPVRDRWESGWDEGGVRLYCTASPVAHGDADARWALQVRARVKVRRGRPGKHFAVGTASMSRDDLLWLRERIDAVLDGTES